MPSGAYEFLVQAPGYGHLRFRGDASQAGARDDPNAFPMNWASPKGATAWRRVRHASLIDDTEGTNWERTGSAVEGKQVLVKLAGARTASRA